MRASDVDAEASGGVQAAMFAIAVLTLPWRGFALSVLWGWFVVPLGVSPIGVFQASGLALLVGLARVTARGVPATNRLCTESMSLDLFAPVLALIFGALVHGLM